MYFLLIMVYRANSAAERKVFLSDLQQIKSFMGRVPWIVCGDFNSDMHMYERSDFYVGMPCSPCVLEFRQCLHDVELTDMHSYGLFLTWSNKRAQGFLEKKLDWFLINVPWMDEFPDL